MPLSLVLHQAVDDVLIAYLYRYSGLEQLICLLSMLLLICNRLFQTFNLLCVAFV